MKRRAFLGGLVFGAIAPRDAGAQQARRVQRIGVLRVGALPLSFLEPFREGLRDLGRVEGRNIVIEYGVASGADQLPRIAADLILSKVDVLVASGTPSVLPARAAAGDVPVVFVAAIDPVATGVVASLARPGGNVTGVSAVHADLTGKRLELARELLPKLTRIALLVRPASPATVHYVKEAETAARSLGVQVQVLAAAGPGDFERVFAEAKGASALLQVDDAVFTAHRAHIAELALKYRLPTISGLSETVDAGGLMAYGPHYGDLYRRAATQVHRLLGGAKPADLPVEQPTRFELVVNLKTAKALGLSIPQPFLMRADRVIE